MNCNTTHYRANSSSVPGDPTLIFWGVLGITLYLLIGLGKNGAAAAAKKSMIIVGGSDALMVMGAVLVWHLARSWNMARITLPAQSGLEIAAFACLIIAAFAKAGVMPFHTWVPAMAEPAPLPVVAFLPAALDKLLGIYFLVRITMDLFRIAGNSWLTLVLMALGALTLMAAVMMALIQHNMKKLLAYHAVSQVGYMVLGIGSGIPLAIAGGLFHMVNNAIYKSCLFLTGGAVEYQTGTTDLDKLGGLVKVMPITFSCFLVSALAICGVPPLNGFFSKWMIYQGLIEMGETAAGPAARLWVVWLLAAMFGSALTLASFMKVAHAVFLGEGPRQGRADVRWTMWAPMAVLSLLCLIFGIWALALPLKTFIYGIVPGLSPSADWLGTWAPGPAAALIIVGILAGWVIYRLIGLKNLRRGTIYIGGEKPRPLENRVTGTDFYRSITGLPVIGAIYDCARKGIFDIYEIVTGVTFFFIDLLRGLHSGILSTYLSWAVLGLVVLTLLLVGIG